MAIAKITSVPGRTVKITFNENASAGCRWDYVGSPENAAVSISSRYQAPGGASFGATGKRQFSAAASEAGEFALNFEYKNSGGEVVDTRTILLSIGAPRA